MTEPQYKTHQPVTLWLDKGLVESIDHATEVLGYKSRTQFINVALASAVVEAMRIAEGEKGK